MTTFKRILAMPYGTSTQMDAADAWYKRFMDFRQRADHEYSIECVWNVVHLTDVGYQARRRWFMTTPGWAGN